MTKCSVLRNPRTNRKTLNNAWMVARLSCVCLRTLTTIPDSSEYKINSSQFQASDPGHCFEVLMIAIEMKNVGAGKMAQWVRVLASNSEGPRPTWWYRDHLQKPVTLNTQFKPSGQGCPPCWSLGFLWALGSIYFLCHITVTPQCRVDGVNTEDQQRPKRREWVTAKRSSLSKIIRVTFLPQGSGNIYEERAERW